MTDNGDSRHLVVTSLLVSVIVALLLSIALGFVGGKAITAGRDAKKATAANTRTLHDNCVASNKARAGARELWEYIITLNPNPTPEQQANIDKVRAKVQSTYAEVQCP